MKKQLYLLLIIIIIGCSQTPTISENLLEFVPQNTIAIAQINDRNVLKNALQNQAMLSSIVGLFPNIEPLVNTMLPPSLESSALVCFTPEGKSQIAVSVLYKVNVADSIPWAEGTSIQYDNVPIILQKKGDQNLYFTQMGNIRYASNSKLVVENSIRNFKNNSPGIQEKNFYQLSNAIDDNVPLNLYVHPDINNNLFQDFKTTPLFPNMGSSWNALDFNTKKDPFTLDGVSFINDSLPDVQSLVKGLGAHTLFTPQLSPQNFTSFLALTLLDYKALEENFKNYVRYQNIALKQIDFSALAAVDELAWMHLKGNTAVFFHIQNEAFIDTLLYNTSGTNKDFRSIPFYAFQFPPDLNKFIEIYGQEVHPEWVAKLGEFLVYAETDALMENIISSFLDGKVLENDFNFKTLKTALANKSSFLWLGNATHLNQLWKDNSSRESALWEKIPTANYPLLALQGVEENNYVQIRLTAQSNNPEQSKNSVVNQFTFNLDAPVVSSPQWLKNHRSKTMDVAVQDENNMLYLFSNTGTLFWKKQLAGKIIGSIHQVDLYKNGRLQMAFRTAERFMILDRNGKVVPPFDIKISNEAPQHLAVFDYDLNRNYRFLLSHGKKLDMFDNRGKKVSGFQLKQTEQALQNPPKHIRFGSNDYIVLQHIDGSVRIVSRIGKDRIQLKQSLKTSANPVFSYRGTFATTDQAGDLVQIDPKGNVVTTPLGLGTDHRLDMTTKSIVSLSENNLNINGLPVQLPFGNYTSPQIFYLNNIIYVTTTDLDTQKVYAFFSNGTPVGGFPVFGGAAVEMSNADGDKAVEMVVQSEGKGLLIYQIN